MLPTSFDESDECLDKPRNMERIDCEALSIKRAEINGTPVVVSCWKMSAEELSELNKTGRVWLAVAGLTMPPVMMMGFSPFKQEPDDDR